MHRRLAAALLVLALVVSAAPAPVAADASDGNTIHRTTTLYLTPAEPGSIGVVTAFEVPSNVRSLTTSIPEGATVTAARGFTQSGPNRYEWDGETAAPRIEFTMTANQTTGGSRAATPGAAAGTPSTAIDAAATDAGRATQSGGYAFADPGPWAIVAVPQFRTHWTYVGAAVSVASTTTVAGDGATGGEIAYLGPQRTHSVTAHGQRVDLVVPAAANLTAAPDEILASISAASGTLQVGERDDHVFVVAAPTGVPWGPAGIEYGGSDAWVRADSRVDDPRNVWLHEYVHTRQGYEPTRDAEWTIEASAEYYAALLTLQQGRIGFPAFRSHLARGTRDPYASAVLSDPRTWPAAAQYLKGALVYGAIDRQIRLATNRSRSMQAVFSAMNRDPDGVTASDFLSYVADAGGSDVRAYAARFTSTTAAPDVWSAAQHENAFSQVPARISYTVASTAIRGPYRNISLPASPTLVTGETFRATVTVTNAGQAEGGYETALAVGDQRVDAASGTLGAGETTTVALAHTFGVPGNYTVSVAGSTYDVTVREPATPVVRDVTVSPSDVRPGDEVTVTVTTANPADRPATGTLPVLLDGEQVASVRTTLDAGATATHAVQVTIPAGAHTIAVGERTVSVSATTTTTTTTAPTPSVGPTGALAGVLLGLAFAARRWP